MKTLNNSQKLVPRTLYINKQGYYFDYLFSDREEKVVDIADLDKTGINIIKYPVYADILKNLDRIKSSDAVILLHSSQEKEIELVSSYFKVMDLNFNVNPFLFFIDENNTYTFEQISRLSKEDEFFKFIYLFIRLQPIFDLNPSKCYKVNKQNYEFIFTKSDFENIDEKRFPNAYLYYKKAVGSFSNSIFLDLIYYDLEGYSNERIEYILKLVQFDDFARIDPSKLNVSDDIINKFEKTVAWKRLDNKIFFLGGLGD